MNIFIVRVRASRVSVPFGRPRENFLVRTAAQGEKTKGDLLLHDTINTQPQVALST